MALALSKAQGEIRSAEKDATNPHFKSSYATLASVWDACRAALSKNELAVVQTGDFDDKGPLLITRLIHSSSAVITSTIRVRPMKDDMQGLGSAWTYARRYALAAIVGVAPDDDDDANEATRPQRQNQNPPPPKQQEKRPSQADWDRNPGWENQLVSEKQVTLLHVTMSKVGVAKDLVKAFCLEKFGKDSSKNLTRGEFQKVLLWLQNEAAPTPNQAEQAIAKAFEPLPFEKETK
jgi:hypothetical protein